MLEKSMDIITKIFAMLMVYIGITMNRNWTVFFAVLLFGFCIAGDILKDMTKK